jgi:hypothetical protein
MPGERGESPDRSGKEHLKAGRVWKSEKSRPLAAVRTMGGYVKMSTILLVILILLLIGAVPAWPYSSGWGYYPSGIVGVLLIVVIVLAIAGRI